MEAARAEVLVLPRRGDSLDLEALLRALGQRDVLSLLVEGGGVVIGALFDQGLVDKVCAIIAPIVVGASDAPTAVAGAGARRLAEAWRLREPTMERLGEDVLITGYPQKGVE